MVSKTCRNEVDYLFFQIYLVLYSIKCYCLHAIGLKEKKKSYTHCLLQFLARGASYNQNNSLDKLKYKIL